MSTDSYGIASEFADWNKEFKSVFVFSLGGVIYYTEYYILNKALLPVEDILTSVILLGKQFLTVGVKSTLKVGMVIFVGNCKLNT